MKLLYVAGKLAESMNDGQGGVTLLIRPSGARRIKRTWLLWLLLLPFAVTLWPGLYNQVQPVFIGIPFFYWFQILCIILTAGLMAALYFLTT